MGKFKLIIMIAFIGGVVMCAPRREKRVVYLDNLETIEIDASSRIEDFIEV